MSLDFGAAIEFVIHITVLQIGKYGLEGLAALASVPPAGASIVVSGPKVVVGSGGPSRDMALL